MSSSRKLLAAVLAILPGLAFAQAEAAKPAEPAAPKLSWAVYGTANVNFQTTRQQKTVARYAVSADSSNIGVRASADLAYDLGATLQCETSASFDGIGVSGICNRNSRVGIASPWGTLFFGNWDAPLKASAYGTKAEDPFMNTDVYGYNSVMGSPGFNYRSGSFVSATGAAPTADAAYPAGSVVSGFDLRAQNSVGFHSAKFEGVSFKVQYSADELRSKNGIIDPQLFGAVVNFDTGPFSVFAAYEYHEDAMGLAGISVPDKVGGTKQAPAFGALPANASTADKSTRDQAWRVGAGYAFETPAGTTTVGAMYEQIFFEQASATDGQVKSFDRPAWQASAKHRIGAHEFRARYNMASEGNCKIVAAPCSTSGYGAEMIALGYAYHLASSTQIYLSWAQIENERNAQYTLTIGGSPNVAGKTDPGKDPRALGLGVRFAF